MRLSRAFALISLSFWVAACGGGPGNATGSTCPPSSSLTYTSFGQAFFQSKCVVCHGAGGPASPKLDTLAAIKANADTIDRSAASGPNATNTYMPESGSVDDATRKQLGEWLACGAPE